MSSLDLEQLRARQAGRPDDALKPLRDVALARLAEHGLPDTRHEDWKYTDLSSVSADSAAGLSASTPSEPSADADALVQTLDNDPDVRWIVIRNGAVAPFAVDAPGIETSRLAETGASTTVATPMDAFNAALLDDGLSIRLTATPDKPLGFLFVDDAETAPGVSASRTVFDVEPGVEASVIEYHASFGPESHYSNALVTLNVGEEATVRHVRIQDRSLEHRHTQRLTATLGTNSVFKSASFDLGGKLIRNDLLIDLPNQGANAQVHGLYLAGGGQHIDNHARVNHRVGPARSLQAYRGILFGKSRAVWNGKAVVYEGADGTDAEQSNHNLLLTDGAEIDTKPELEIYAEDVRCSHGTTVGQLDERALFYLRSRGLAEDDARRLLVHAFAAATLGDIPVDAVRDRIAALLENRLNDIKDVTDLS